MAYIANLIPTTEFTVIHLNQYEYGIDNVITVAIFNGDTPFTIPDGSTVVVTGTRPDGKEFVASEWVLFEGNEVIFEVQAAMTAVYGEFEFEIVISNGNNRWSTTNLKFNVERSPINAEVPISEDEIPACIDVAHLNAMRAQAAANEAKESAESVRSDVVDAKEAALTATGAATTAASSASTASDASSRAEESATDAAISVSTAHTYSLQAKTYSEQAANSATSASSSEASAKHYAEVAADAATASPSAQAAADSAEQAATSAASAQEALTEINNVITEKVTDLMPAEVAAQVAQMQVKEGQTVIDATLTVSGAAADAKATGDKVNDVQSQIDSILDNEPCQFIRQPFEIAAYGLDGRISGNRGTCTLEDNVLKVTNTGSLTYFGWYARTTTIGEAQTNGHKWYVRIDGFDTTGLQHFISVSCVALKVGNPNNASFIGTEGILNLTDDCDTITVFVNCSETVQLDEYVTFTGFQVFDLTEMFGAGFEPTIEEFKAVYGIELYDRNSSYDSGISREEQVVIGKLSNDISSGLEEVAGGLNALDLRIDEHNADLVNIDLKVDEVRTRFNNDTETITTDWVMGGINNDSGEEYTSTIRIRSNAIDVTPGEILLIENPEEYILFYYYRSDGSYLSLTTIGNNENERRIVPMDAAILKIVVRHKDSSDIDLLAGKHVRLKRLPKPLALQFIKIPFIIGDYNNRGSIGTLYSTLTTDGSTMIVHNNDTRKYFGFYSHVYLAEHAITSGHKWYVRIDGLDTSHITNFTNVSIIAVKSGAGDNAVINASEGVLSITTDCNAIRIQLNSSSNLTSEDYATFTGFQVFDLTEMFGAGFEPTIEEFKAVYGTELYDRNVTEIESLSNVEKVAYDHLKNLINSTVIDVTEDISELNNRAENAENRLDIAELQIDKTAKYFNRSSNTIDIDWVKGGINSTTGENYDSEIRLRSSVIEVTPGDAILIDNPTNLHVLLYYYDVSNAFMFYIDAYTNSEDIRVIPNGAFSSKIVIRYEDGAAISPIIGNEIRFSWASKPKVAQYIFNPLQIGAGSNYGSLVANRSILSKDSNDVITVTNNAELKYFGFYSNLCHLDSARTNGHKWYVRIDGFDASHVTGFTQVSIVAVRSGVNNAGVDGTKGIITLTADCPTISVFVNSSSNLTSADYATFTGFQVVDLTEMFGAGFEPSLEVFEQIYGLETYDRCGVYDSSLSNEVRAVVVQTKETIKSDIAASSAVSLNAADVAMGGVLKRWVVTETITATLYNNGTFWLSGNGVLPVYSYTETPPWIDNKYMRCIKKIIIDDTVTINYGLYACFTQYDENKQALYYQNEYEGRIDYTPNITCIYERDFGQFDYHHINLAKHKAPFGKVNGLPIPNMYKHALFSVPKEVCNEAFINAMKSMLIKSNNTYNKHGVTLFITDSPEFHQAVMQQVDYVYGSAFPNVASILGPDLAEDGFPSYWTEPMKRSLFEVIPYIGKQYLFYKDESEQRDEAYPYRAKGLASMNTYAGYGWPDPFSYQADANVYISSPSDGEILFEKFKAWSLSRYRGQPFSSSLEQITTGLSCSGFISWFYWRFFKENFTLGASRNYNTKLGPIDNPLPLKDITFEELQPFDLLNFAYDNNKDGIIDKNDNGGHVAIFLSKYINKDGDEKIVVLNCGMGGGVTFSRWRFDDAWFEQEGQINTAKAMRFDKESISINMISFYDKSDDPEVDPDDGGGSDDDSDPDGGSEPA